MRERLRVSSIHHLAILLGLSMAVAVPAQAQDMYLGAGLPGGLTIGYAHPMGNNWGLRGDFSSLTPGSYKYDKDLQSYDVTLKSRILGIYADWFPFGNGFRLVGGLTANDIQADYRLTSTGTASINGNVVSMAGKYFKVRYQAPSATPYLGIGYGHHANTAKGIGFYADIGMLVGSPAVSVDTNLVGTSGTGGTVTQADVEAQKRKVVDASSSPGVGFIALGVVYRY